MFFYYYHIPASGFLTETVLPVEFQRSLIFSQYALQRTIKREMPLNLNFITSTQAIPPPYFITIKILVKPLKKQKDPPEILLSGEP